MSKLRQKIGHKIDARYPLRHPAPHQAGSPNNPHAVGRKAISARQGGKKSVIAQGSGQFARIHTVMAETLSVLRHSPFAKHETNRGADLGASSRIKQQAKEGIFVP
ncbi:hypothetical protein [Thalassospira sp. HJ]|uniref:hypothetical protein n=1 Tax=Thalassospira sp. HJ TaxID=1616823 RepID=UPI001F2E6074|nr:hypothetical protein [Thalassospira sp. HJ]